MEQTDITDSDVEASFFANDTLSKETELPVKVATHISTRLFSFITLAGIVVGCVYLGQQTYYVVSDSWVAPAILGPDNDLVLEEKLKLSTLLLEKGKAQATLEADNAALEAGDKAVADLDNLKKVASNALTWTQTTTGQQVSMGSADMHTLASQKEEINQMLERQELLVDGAKKDLAAGLIQKQDYDRELQSLDQVQIALFENERTKMQSELLLTQAAMGQQSLHAGNSGSMPMPEQVMSMSQLITLECQLLQTQADMRAKSAEKDATQFELQKIASLENDLLARPIFKAIDQNQDIAFAPYPALHGLVPGAKIMDCVWDVFNCREVGTVLNIIPGETILPDIFNGGQVRGQFITLSLNKNDRDQSMQSKVLRIR